MLKQDLHTSTNDLLVVLERFEQVVDGQFDVIKVNLANARKGTPTIHSSLFQLLHRHISAKAIKYVKETHDRYLPVGPRTKPKSPIPATCDCDSMNTSGYPCIHIIQDAITANRSLIPRQFHQHWHLYKVNDRPPPIDPTLLIQDPAQVRRRGRPTGATNFSQITSTPVTSTQVTQFSLDPLTQKLTPFERSTQREPSAHEYVLEGPRGGLSGRGGRARIRGAGPGRPRGSRARGGARGQGRGRGRGQTADELETSEASETAVSEYFGNDQSESA